MPEKIPGSNPLPKPIEKNHIPVAEPPVRQEDSADALAQFESLSQPEPEAWSETVCIEKAREMENLCNAFESKHALSALHEIQEEFTMTTAPLHPVRGPAMIDFNAIAVQWVALSKQPNVPAELYQQLRTKYHILQAAIGTVRTGAGLDHTNRMY